MKKLFLLILFFTSISFAQLVKPSKASNTQIDTASNKHFIYVDSTINKSAYGSLNNTNNLHDAFSWGVNSYNSSGSTLNAHNFISMGNGNGQQYYGNSAPMFYNYTLGDNSFTQTNNNFSRDSVYGINLIGNNSMSGFGGASTDVIKDIVCIGNRNLKNMNALSMIVIGNDNANNWQSTSTYSYPNNIIIGNNNGYYGYGTGNIWLGYNILNSPNFNYVGHYTNTYIIGTPYVPYSNGYTLSHAFIVNDPTYFPTSNFVYGDFVNDNYKIKGSISIDSTGKTLQYHSTIGSPNRTAGIDSLTSGVDTIRTTAYDSNSLVFITDLSASGTPGHQYIDKINSVPGSYFIVLSKNTLDNSLFNWFILKTY